MEKVYIKISIYKNLDYLLKEGLHFIKNNKITGNVKELLVRYIFNKLFKSRAEKVNFVKDKETGKYSIFVSDGTEITYIFDEYIANRIHYMASWNNRKNENNDSEQNNDSKIQTEKIFYS